jgi:hypothetical protein
LKRIGCGFAWLTLVGLLALGCARGGAPSAVGQPHANDAEQARALQIELSRYETELLAGLRVGATPDCHRARDLLKTICELSERICLIAQRNSADAALAGSCQDARKRCEKARAKVAGRCADAP